MNRYLLPALLALISCRATRVIHPREDHKLQAIEVRQVNSFLGESNYRAYYLDSLVVYKYPYFFDSSADDNSMISGVRYRYFVFNRDSSYGYRYDPHDARHDGVRLRADSVMKFMIKGADNFDELISREKPDSSIWNAAKTELKEVYTQAEKEDTPAVRLVLHYSKGMNHLRESLNERVDSIKKMKLFKTEMILNELYSQKHNKRWPATVFATEMKEIPPENVQEIMSYVYRYKKRTERSD